MTKSDSELSEDFKLVIFGWIVTILGIPKKGNPDKYNELTEKLATLISNKEREARVKAIKGYKKINNKFENEIRIDELEYILNNSSGGGDWRRIISQRLETLKAREGK